MKKTLLSILIMTFLVQNGCFAFGNKNKEVNNMSKFCANCGFKMDKNNKFCPNCGSSPDNPQPTMPIQSDKSSGLAAVLSFLIIGLGQIYLGLTKRGLILFVLAVISGFLMLIYIGWIIWLFVWIYAIYDAYNSGEKIKNGEYVEDTLNMDNLF